MDMDDQLLKMYLKRIGMVDLEPPSKAFLFKLHQAHVEKVPWQTFDVFAGRPQPIDMERSVAMIANGGSGYCFHLNGAFAALLQALGFHVAMHRAGVQTRGREPKIDANHVGLTVTLPEENEPESRWIVDVGLGDMIFEPVPLHPGFYQQEPFTYTVEGSVIVNGGFRLVHDPNGTFAGVDYDLVPVKDIMFFQPNHMYLSQHPDSPWVNLSVAKKRHSRGYLALTGCVFTRCDQSGRASREVLDKNEWFDLLSDIFGISLNNYSLAEKEQIWAKALQNHLAWKGV